MEFTIPDWRPVSLNCLLRLHWASRNRLVKAEKKLVGMYFLQSGLPKATSKRRVEITVVYARKAGGKVQDSDNSLKNLLDSLVLAGALVDDSPEW